MKPFLFILIPWIMLVGCDKVEQYSNGNIIALSAIYDFENIAGNVHQLHQSVSDADGNVIHDVKAEFDRQGCITRLDMASKLSGTVHLQRVQDSLSGRQDNDDITYQLGEKCQIVSKKNKTKNESTRYKYDEHGLLTETAPSYAGMRYKYNRAENGDLTSTEGYLGSQLIEKTDYRWHQKALKPADYRLKIKTLTGESTIDMRCNYKEKVPFSCNIVRQPASESAGITLKAKLDVTFY